MQASRLLLVDRRLAASRLALAAGDAAVAEQVAQDGLALEPAHGELWGVLAYARAARDDAAGTVAAAARAQALLPTPAITYLMASTERRHGHAERALAILREFSETVPGLIRPRVLLAETYVELGQIDAAKATLRDALTMPSKFVTKEEQRLRTAAAVLLQTLNAR
jgi:predicted Zn-dependent protease